MPPTVQEFQRRLLLWTSLIYGILAAAVPTSLIAHPHLALPFEGGAAAAAAALVAAVLRLPGLGIPRGRLASGMLLTGPLGTLWLARRTRRWQPLLLVRPRAAPRGFRQ